MKLTRAESVLEQQLDDEIVLLDLESGRYFGLQAVGVRAWFLLGESGDTDRVQVQLLEEFEVEDAELRQDLDALWHDLLEAGLVVAAPET
jgi:hypothetical protein